MVLDKPVFGQGPGMILAVYPRYRWPEAPNPRQPHLHNNLLEVAAERGLPGLAFFLWWAVAALAAALARHGAARPRARAPPGPREECSARWPRSSWRGSSNTISATPRS